MCKFFLSICKPLNTGQPVLIETDFESGAFQIFLSSNTYQTAVRNFHVWCHRRILRLWGISIIKQYVCSVILAAVVGQRSWLGGYGRQDPGDSHLLIEEREYWQYD